MRSNGQMNSRQGPLSASDAALLKYFRANAWAERQKARHGDRSAVWAWEQPELQQQLLHLRGAVQHQGFHELPDLRQCQVFTNLANQIDTVGRCRSAGILESGSGQGPRFGMTLGNRGYGLAEYARGLYDPGYQRVFLCQAHKSLSAALAGEAEYEGGGYGRAKALFASIRDQIAARIDLEEVDLDGHEIGASEEERAYRLWCLNKILFLNSLNHSVLTASPRATFCTYRRSRRRSMSPPRCWASSTS